MFKKKNIPIFIFLCFENVNTTIWTSSGNKYNNYSLHTTPVFLKIFTILIKKELTLNNSTLIESSIVDLKNYDTNVFKLNNKNLNYLLLNIFYFYFLKIKIISFTFLNNSIDSIDSIFFNANWLEREFSEMYGIFLINKVDTRNLLLDYTINEHPMKKSFPCVGFKEVLYNMYTDSIEYANNEFVEL